MFVFITLLYYYVNLLCCSVSIYLSSILLVNRLALALIVINGVLRTPCACVLVAKIMEYKNVVSVNIDFSTEIFHKTFVNDIQTLLDLKGYNYSICGIVSVLLLILIIYISFLIPPLHCWNLLVIAGFLAMHLILKYYQLFYVWPTLVCSIL